MNELILNNIFSIFNIAIFPEVLNNFQNHFLLNSFYYTQMHNIILGVIISSISFLIFIRANHIYSKTHDKKMAVIAAGFLFGGLFEILHFLNSGNIASQFYYFFFENFAYSFALFVSILYAVKNSAQIPDNFRKKVFIFSTVIFLSIIIIERTLGSAYIEKYFPYSSVEVIYTALYFLSALLYADMRLNNQLKPISFFIIGIFLMGISEIYVLTPDYYVSTYRLITHIEQLIGEILILYGFNDILFRPKIFSIRQKFLAYPTIFLIFSYLTLILISSAFFRIIFPFYVTYFFLIFFVGLDIIFYILSTKLTVPITNIIRGIEKFTPDHKPELLPVISQDETGILTNEFNKNAELIWNNTQELLLKQKQIQELVDKEKLLGKITESIRSTLDLDQVLNNICQELLKLYKVDRVAIASYLQEVDSSEWSKQFEVKANFHVCGVKDIDFSAESKRYLRTHILEENQDLIIEDMESSDLPDYFKDTYQKLNVKSILVTPVRRENDKWGMLGLFQSESRKWTQNELDFLHKMVDQIFIAVKQAELYSSTKKQVEKESLLRNIVSAIRGTLDINEVKNEIVVSIGKALNADKCFIVEYDQINSKFIPIEYEYLAKPEFKSNIGLNVENYAPEIAQIEKETNELIISESEKFIKENNLENTATAKYLKDLQIKYIFSIRLTYAGQFLGMLVIHNLTKKEQLSEDTIEFMRTISGQVSIAIYQGKLYEKTRQTAKREALVRKIIETIRSTLDIDETLTIICDEVAKLFNVQRAAIVEFPIFQNYEESIIRREYKISHEIKGLTDIEYDKKTGAYWAEKTLKEGINLVIDNIRESNTPDYFKNSYEALGVKSILGFPVKKEKDNWGTFVLSEYNYYRHWTDEEINLLQTIASQVYIAIKQAELYSTTKKQAERESILRKIIAKISSTLDIDEIKKAFVTETGQILGSDLNIFYEVDPVTGFFQPVDRHSVYLSSPDVKSMIGVSIEDYGWGEFFRKQGNIDVIYSDVEKFIKDYNLYGELGEKYIREFNIKSSIVVPIIYFEKLLGLLAINYTRQSKVITDDDVNFVKTIANQAGIALYQAKLYKTVKQTADREALLRKVIETIRSTLDLDETLNVICDEVARLFNAQRATIVEFPDPQNHEKFITRREYKLSPEIKGLSNAEYDKKAAAYWAEKTLVEGERLIIDNIPESDTPDYFKKSYEAIGVKSILGFPVKKGEEARGTVVLSEYNYYRHWTDEEINLLETIASQVYIAIKQAELYSTTKRQADREVLLRKVIETIRSSLDIDEMIAIICNEIGKLFNVQRVALGEYPYQPDYSEWVVRYEYKTKEDIKGVGYPDYDPRSKIYIGKTILDEGKMLILDNIPKSDTPDYFKKSYEALGVKSSIGVPIRRGEDKWGVLFASEYDDYRHWTEEEIALLETIANQIYIAIKQAELYSTTKKQVEREALLRKIIETIRSSLDIDETLTIICDEVAKLFNVERAAIIEYPNPQNYEEFVTRIEYKLLPEIKGITSKDFDTRTPAFWGEKLFKKEENIVIDNITESDTPEYFKKTYNSLGVKSIMGIPVRKGENIWGLIGLSEYNYYRHWTDEEINLLETIASQVYIAIKQAELYSTTKKQADREALLRKITETIRSTLDINEVLTIICDEVAKLVNVQRATIVEFPNPQNYEDYIIRREYKIFPEVKGLSDIAYEKKAAAYWGEKLLRENVDLIIDNIELSDTPDYFKKTYKALGVKSTFGFPIRKGEDAWGTFVLSEYNYYRHWTEEEINLIRTIADQVYIAIKQAELYSATREYGEREKALREIISTIRSTLDINEIKRTFINEIGTFFKADRVVIADYDYKTNNYYISSEGEYRSSDKVKTFVGRDFTAIPGFVEYVRDTHLQGKDIIFNDLEKYLDENNLRETDIEKFYRDYDFISSVVINIYYRDLFLGNLVVNFGKQRDFSDDDIKFIKTLADQAGVAIYQSKLYLKEKHTAEREVLLRNIISTIRSTLDINKIKRTFVNELGTFFKADRIVFSEFNAEKNVFLPTDEYSEYLTDPALGSLIGYDWNLEKVLPFIQSLKEQEEINIVNLDEYLKEHNLENSDLEKLFREWKIQSSYNILIMYGKEIMGFFCIDYIKEKHEISTEELEFLRTLTNQAGIALHQAKLYETSKRQANKEALLRKITQTIRSTLDINEIKTLFVSSIGSFFKADRVLYSEFNPQQNIYMPVDKYSEYLSSPREKSFVGYDWSTPESKEYMQPLIEKQELNVYNLDEYLEKNPKGPDFINLFRGADVQSSYNIPVLYLNKIEGYFSIDFTQREYRMTEEELEFIRSIANQAGIALYQSRLYLKIQQTAEKERLLREIISEIKIFQTFDLAYEYVLEKTAEIFDTERAIFIEIPEYKFKKLSVKYEYLKNKNLPSIKNLQIPESCQHMFNGMISDLKTITVNNIEEFHTDDKEVQNFFKENSIRSFIASPFVKYNKEVKIFGILSLCSSKTKTWSSKEVELLKSIAESVVTVLWEIAKLNEINELRDTFILTLAHDLQVPLVGEKKALEFLESRLPDQPIGKFREFIRETIKSNQNLFNLLTRLLDSYYYESGKKSLNLVEYNIKTIINQVITKLKQSAESKSIKIDTKIEENLPNLKMDRDEIEKALYNLIENAVMYTMPGGQIVIKSSRQDKDIITCVSDNGPGIEPEIREKIFKRYEMAAAIERKIGAGLSLYLTKQIVEAHKGKIWYETELGKGTTFCLSLPFS